MAINKPKPKTRYETMMAASKQDQLTKSAAAKKKARGSYTSMMAASVQDQKKKTRGYSTPTPATTKQETGSYYGTTGSKGYVSGKVMPAHTTPKEKAASPASTLAKQAAAYKKAREKGGTGSMSGMLSAAGGIGNIANMKALHAAAYPKAKTGTTKTGTTKTATTKQTPAERRKSLLSKYGGTSSVRTGRS